MSSTVWRRIIGALTLLSSVLLLQGCSAVRLGYANSADIGYWWLDNYLDFQDAQTAAVRPELRKLLAWHRSVELPKLAAELNRAQGVLAQSVTPAQVCALQDSSRILLDNSLRRLEAPALPVLLSLSETQLQHLRNRHDRNNADYRARWGGDAASRAEQRLKSLRERYDMVYGSLEDAQVEVLRRAIASSSYQFERTMAERQQRQNDMLATLREMLASPAQAATRWHLYLQRFGDALDSRDSDYAMTLRQESCATFAAVHNAASAEQRQRAVQRLAGYEKDARELAQP